MPTLPTCFIILPITTPVGEIYRKEHHFLTVLNGVCVPAVRKIGFKALKPLEKGMFLIEQQILARLQNSNLVLCDLSSLNPNVLFELGIRRALNKPFVIIRDERTKLPFDLKNFNCLKYDSSAVHNKRERQRLINRLASHLQKTAVQKTAPTEPLIGAVAAGITRIYPTRQAAMKDVSEHLKQVSHRLWIMGVGLSEEFRLSTHLDAIQTKVKSARARNKKFDARILILDALTSTGVFRTLLESTSDGVDEIVNASRQLGEEYVDDPYFNERLYHEFEFTWRRFKGYPALNNRVRFYGHAPTGWLVIADDTAYFQPYTFGSDPDSKKSDGAPIGPLMPVFRFENGEHGRSFKILEKHFLRLWLTTDSDLFHVQARHAEASDTVTKIFHNRGYWLKQVLATLHKPTGERRSFPRKVCKSKLINYVSRNTRSEPTEERSAQVHHVLNFSREGLAFRLRKKRLLEIKLQVKKGSAIRVLSFMPPQPEGGKKKEKAGEFVKKVLVDGYRGRFRVVHSRDEGEFVVVGLKPIEKRTTR